MDTAREREKEYQAQKQKRLTERLEDQDREIRRLKREQESLVNQIEKNT